jgi:hypothetical protein
MPCSIRWGTRSAHRKFHLSGNLRSVVRRRRNQALRFPANRPLRFRGVRRTSDEHPETTGLPKVFSSLRCPRLLSENEPVHRIPATGGPRSPEGGPFCLKRRRCDAASRGEDDPCPTYTCDIEGSDGQGAKLFRVGLDA